MGASNFGALIFSIAPFLMAFIAVALGAIVLIVLAASGKIAPKSSGRLKQIVCSCLCLAVAAVSFVTNMGWIRFFLGLPLIAYGALFFIANCLYGAFANHAPKRIQINNGLFYLSYLLTNVLLPDGGDTSSSMAVFFGLIRNQTVRMICGFAVILTFTFSIMTLKLQFDYIRAKRIEAREAADSQRLSCG